MGIKLNHIHILYACLGVRYASDQSRIDYLSIFPSSPRAPPPPLDTSPRVYNIITMN